MATKEGLIGWLIHRSKSGIIEMVACPRSGSPSVKVPQVVSANGKPVQLTAAALIELNEARPYYHLNDEWEIHLKIHFDDRQYADPGAAFCQFAGVFEHIFPLPAVLTIDAFKLIPDALINEKALPFPAGYIDDLALKLTQVGFEEVRVFIKDEIVHRVAFRAARVAKLFALGAPNHIVEGGVKSFHEAIRILLEAFPVSPEDVFKEAMLAGLTHIDEPKISENKYWESLIAAIDMSNYPFDIASVARVDLFVG